ncbi:hypothetical protein J2Z69_001319 [Paenibacillus shirakamiensis]|uniref:Uncharacterized protein n=1 Tax=Paenibacillus shirakamiensis TaxID=1265935 RepID=A0ABS4JF13_9BACL|nr:hypothetical protein [Paenibacillus shirakamiensis]MBP2000300.1 hypothetical protein [Paenibacillus shirakamiensis]
MEISGTFFLSIVCSVILFFILGLCIQPINQDGGMLVIIGIILSIQLSLITAILLHRRSKTQTYEEHIEG